jgi:CheY-like chemotaxis protein
MFCVKQNRVLRRVHFSRNEYQCGDFNGNGRDIESRASLGIFLLGRSFPLAHGRCVVILRRLSHEFIPPVQKPATSPADASAVLTTLTPDLIITDFHLNQKESGVDIIRNARDLSGRITPAILATGDTGPSVRTLGIGDLHRVSKPVDATILITLVQRLLASKPAAKPTPPGCGR